MNIYAVTEMPRSDRAMQAEASNPMAAIAATVNEMNYAYPSGFRLSTQTGVSVPTSDRTAQGTLYLAIHTADYLLTPNLSATDFDIWHPGQLSLALSATSGKAYDVFCWNNAGTPTLASGRHGPTA